MQVDFYHLARDPLAVALALIAGKATAGGERMVVVSGDAAQRKALSQALWSASPTSFLANGEGDEAFADRQPIVLSETAHPVNGARFLAIADNVWRDGDVPFSRTFFFFEDGDREAARAAWSMLGKREGVVRNYWKQDGGRWVRAG